MHLGFEGFRRQVLVCPAQFGTDKDYADLVQGLRARGHPVAVAPLVFKDWLRLIPASLTKEYRQPPPITPCWQW